MEVVFPCSLENLEEKHMKLGIVGLPNVGKSTLFNAITQAGAESANYPFCTIDPNVGMVAVPDERLQPLTDLYHAKKTTPAVVGRGSGQQIPVPYPRGRRNRTRCPLLRQREHRSRRGLGRSGARHRDHQSRAHSCGHRASGTPSGAHAQGSQGRQEAAARRRHSGKAQGTSRGGQDRPHL